MIQFHNLKYITFQPGAYSMELKGEVILFFRNTLYLSQVDIFRYCKMCYM